MQNDSKDMMALSRYGLRYEQLSAFGKRDIDKAFASPTYSVTLQDDNEEKSLRHTLAKRDAQLVEANRENDDLWEQLNEARTELEELRAQFNPPSS